MSISVLKTLLLILFITNCLPVKAPAIKYVPASILSKITLCLILLFIFFDPSTVIFLPLYVSCSLIFLKMRLNLIPLVQ